MDHAEFGDSSIRRLNRQILAKDEDCEKLIAEMLKVEKFMNDFGYLTFGRDYVSCGYLPFSLQMISTSCELTVGSMISCCGSGCLADAYSLLRKYRDDLFFYLYITVYDTCLKSNQESPTTAQMEEKIKRWINNDLNDLHISSVLKAIGQSPRVKDAVQKYKLEPYFKALGNRLNNYVHSNGVGFYNRNVNVYIGNILQIRLTELLQDLRSVTITFLFLLTLCSPLSVMSMDYIEYLECNDTPPVGSEYWVAPFITRFFESNHDLIDESCMEYLRENTPMKFEQ